MNYEDVENLNNTLLEGKLYIKLNFGTLLLQNEEFESVSL